MAMAGNILKILIGIVVIIVGIIWYTGPKVVLGGYGLFEWYKDFLTLLKGSIGLVLLFVGLIVAWMGYDNYKMERDIVKEEKKETRIE